MDRIYEFYKLWRWCFYNGIKYFSIDMSIEKFISLNNTIEPSLIDCFVAKQFNVSNELIIKYETDIVEQYLETLKLSSLKANGHLVRPKFVENCFIDYDSITEQDHLETIKTNIVFYYWWDLMSYEELIFHIVNVVFLKSTKKLIGVSNIINFLKQEYPNKELFIKGLLKEFRAIKEDSFERLGYYVKSVIYNYSWMYFNELKFSIRVVENSCRLNCGEKIIGAFYNEDLLFREVLRVFGDSHNVVSQGSPAWLNPQRFDIYIPEINIAIEYQGEQHFKPVDFAGKGKYHAKKQFEKNLKRDQQKLQKAKLNDCEVLYVNPKFDIKEVIISIRKLIESKS